ncbi:alpha/beta-hydrolase [Atractiella rhizophila]|nr:alpha/beta-hydrolase [Atractiella rhizophila]
MSASMDQPSRKSTAFILIPGSFCTAAVCEPIAEILRQAGYEALAMATPSAQIRPQGPATFEEDVEAILSAIEGFKQRGKEVIIGMNSYAAWPGTQAAGIANERGRKEGQTAGVVGLAYLASFLPKSNESLRDVMGDFQNTTNDYMTLAADASAIFNEVSEEEGQEFIKLIGSHHSSVSWLGKLTHTEYINTPTTYLFCEKDLLVTPALQQDMVNWADANGANIIKKSCAAGHCPMLTMPNLVADVLKEMAENRQ